MTDQNKLEAIKTYLKWDIETLEDATEALDHIWYVVMENHLKPAESSVDGYGSIATSAAYSNNKGQVVSYDA